MDLRCSMSIPPLWTKALHPQDEEVGGFFNNVRPCIVRHSSLNILAVQIILNVFSGSPLV